MAILNERECVCVRFAWKFDSIKASGGAAEGGKRSEEEISNLNNRFDQTVRSAYRRMMSLTAEP